MDPVTVRRSRTPWFGRAGLLGAALILMLPLRAAGGTPGVWEQLGPTGVRFSWQPALLRLFDGILHVAATRRDGDKLGLVHRAVAADGTLSVESQIVAGWQDIADSPALVRFGPRFSPTAPFLRVLFSGRLLAPNGDELQLGINTATAPLDGATWTLLGEPIATGQTSNDSYGADCIGATVTDDLFVTPLTAWTESQYLWVHSGLDKSNPAQASQFQRPSPYFPELATDDQSGAIWLAYFSNAEVSGSSQKEDQGIFVQQVDPGTGAPIGARILAPGSTVTGDFGGTVAHQPSQRVSITGRTANDVPGVFVAYGSGYPTLREVLVWRVGADLSPPMVVTSIEANDEEIEHIHLAATPEGRLWATWSQGTRVLAARSNVEATLFGSAVASESPTGTESINTVIGNAQVGRLDLVANLTMPPLGDEGTAFWHTQFLPGLTLTPSRPFVPLPGKKILFTVTDAGVAVPGVLVQAGKKSGVTGPDGKVKLRVKGGKRGTKRPITATLEGYAPATLVMLVGKSEK